MDLQKTDSAQASAMARAARATRFEQAQAGPTPPPSQGQAILWFGVEGDGTPFLVLPQGMSRAAAILAICGGLGRLADQELIDGAERSFTQGGPIPPVAPVPFNAAPYDHHPGITDGLLGQEGRW